MPLEADVRATVLIAALCDSPSLRSVLAIVRDQADAEDSEVLLVLNHSPDRLTEESETALSILCDHVAFEPTPGKSAALNRGIALARGEVIAFTDDDTQPRNGWLAALARRLLDPDRDPRLVGVGGRVVPVFPSDAPEWIERMVFSRVTHYIGPHHDLGDAARDYGSAGASIQGLWVGANMAIRREVFERFAFSHQLGPSPVTGLRGGEETALSHELITAGLRLVYEPGAVVDHPVRRERSTYSFVRRAHYVHGRESIAVRRHLGVAPWSRLVLVRKIIKHSWRRVRPEGPVDDITHTLTSLRLAELSGRLRESLRRAERGQTVRPVLERNTLNVAGDHWEVSPTASSS